MTVNVLDGYLSVSSAFNCLPVFAHTVTFIIFPLLFTSCPEGAFLVRVSDSFPGEFTLTFARDGAPNHCRIRCKNGKYFLTDQVGWERTREGERDVIITFSLFFFLLSSLSFSLCITFARIPCNDTLLLHFELIVHPFYFILHFFL
jgi:hypothetical protein